MYSDEDNNGDDETTLDDGIDGIFDEEASDEENFFDQFVDEELLEDTQRLREDELYETAINRKRNLLYSAIGAAGGLAGQRWAYRAADQTWSRF